MPIRCRITGINGSALLQMSRVIWERIPQVTPAQRSRNSPFAFFFLLNTPLLRLTSERYEAIRCRWPECASLLIACPGTNRCHPVTTLPTTTYTAHADSHTPYSGPTNGEKSWHVSNSPGSASVQPEEGLSSEARGLCSATSPNSKECFEWRAQKIHHLWSLSV